MQLKQLLILSLLTLSFSCHGMDDQQRCIYYRNAPEIPKDAPRLSKKRANNSTQPPPWVQRIMEASSTKKAPSSPSATVRYAESQHKQLFSESKTPIIILSKEQMDTAYNKAQKEIAALQKERNVLADKFVTMITKNDVNGAAIIENQISLMVERMDELQDFSKKILSHLTRQHLQQCEQKSAESKAAQQALLFLDPSLQEVSFSTRVLTPSVQASPSFPYGEHKSI